MSAGLGPIVLLGLGGLLAGWAIWLLLTVPRPMGWSAAARERRRRSVHGIHQGWLALTGLPLTPRDVRHLGWLIGALTVLGLMALTRNPLIATAFGLVGMLVPEAGIRYWARKQWQRLDVAAYGATHMLQAKIHFDVPVLEAFRALLPDVGEPFRGWVTPCVTAEATGHPLEVTLKRQAEAIQHVELATLADVLAAERTHGRTAPVIAQTVELWSQRLQADAVRRGTLAGGTMLGYGVVLAGIVAFWGLVLLSPALRHGLDHGYGFWLTGLGAWLVALAGYVQNRVSRQAEAV